MRQEATETKPAVPAVDQEPPKKESVASKRPAEQPAEPAAEPKKQCVVKEPPLEDDLSEISDDADEILNMDEVSREHIKFLVRNIVFIFF